MKRTIAMVLALMMVLALVPVLGMNEAQADGVTITINPPTKINYIYGEELLLAGLTVTATRTVGGITTVVEAKDGDTAGTKPSTATFTPEFKYTWHTASGAAATDKEVLTEAAFGGAKAKTHKIYVSYSDDEGYTSTGKYFTITVGKYVPTAKVTILSNPTTVYTGSDMLDLSGMQLKVDTTYGSDTKSELVSFDDSRLSYTLGSRGIAYNGALKDFTVGSWTLGIKYHGVFEIENEDGSKVPYDVYKTVTLTPKIVIKDSAPKATISVKTPPDKVSYVFGEGWKFEGLVVSVSVTDGKGGTIYTNDIDMTVNPTRWSKLSFFFDGHAVAQGDTISEASYTVGAKNMTIVYADDAVVIGQDAGGNDIYGTVTARTTQLITINKPEPKAVLTVLTQPTELYYVPGASLNLNGMKIKLQHYCSDGSYEAGYDEDNKIYWHKNGKFYSDADCTTEVALDISYKLNDKPIGATGVLDKALYSAGKSYKLALIYNGEVTEASGVNAPVTATASFNVSVVKERVNGIAVNGSGPDTTTFFLGERLNLTGLAYSILYTNVPAGTTSRTDVSKKLGDFTLRLQDADGTLLSLDSLPYLTDTLMTKLGEDPTAVSTFKIWAGYKDATQNRWFSNSTVEITVLPTPTDLGVAEKAPGTNTDANPIWEYDSSRIGEEIPLESTLTGVGITDPNDASLVSWGSLNSAVATVSTSGKLKLLSVGETTIQVSTRGDDPITKSFKVVVSKTAIPLTGIQLNKTDLVMTVNESDKLVTSLVPSGASYEADTITWKVYDAATGATEVAGVVAVTPDPENKLTANIKALSETSDETTPVVTDGQVIVKVTVTDGTNTYTASCAIDVNIKPVERVYVTPTAITLLEGQAYPIVGTALPYDATDLTLTWLSSNEKLATVTDGRVLVKDITDTEWTNIINPATGAKWTAKDVAANKCYTTVNISCSSASNKKLTAATCVVTIKQGVIATQISLNKYSASLNIGGSSQLSATILPTTATIKTVTWSSTDPTVATVSSTGKITGVKAGTCIVRAISNGSGADDLTAECYVTVSAVMSGSIGLSALNMTLYHDQTATLVATVIPSNATNKEVTFVSSNPKVATVDPASGLVTAIGNGKTTITVTANDGSKASASCYVTVMDKVSVKSITLNMKDFSLLRGDTTLLSATVEPDYASETEVTWTSSNPNAVSVDEKGKVSGLVAGQSAKITATAKDGTGVSASVEISVVSTFYGNGKVVNCLRRVNVREKASGSSAFKGYAYLNEEYKVLGKTGSWYLIRYKKETCYIWSAYIRLIGNGSAEYTSAGAATITTPVGGTGTGTGTTSTCTVVNCVYAVNVRSGPGTNYDKLGIAPLNAAYKYLGTYGDWYKVQYNATTEGYIHANYITAS